MLPKLGLALAFGVSLLWASLVTARAGELVEHLPTDRKVVALTFDACESKTPAYFDEKILGVLRAEKVPFTIFVAGKFALHNRQELVELSHDPLVEIENHSFSHDNHMERMDRARARAEIADNGRLLEEITGRRPLFFRFPAGNFAPDELDLADSIGYRVVHWSFASGDPAKSVTPSQLHDWVMSKAKPGGILIFHINGRGYATGDALPAILKDLRAKGYGFVRLDEMVKPAQGNSP